jgi:hypothetical protein
MASWQPKKKKHYEHRVIITSQSNPEYAYVLKFSNDRKAKNHVKSAKEADNIIAIEYEKRVIPEITEEGVIL